MLVKGYKRSGIVIAVLAGLSLLIPVVAPMSGAYAAAHRPRVVHTAHRAPRDIAFSPEKDAAMVVDGATGKVLYERNPDSLRYPASLTKMMTLYLLFEALEKGTMSLDTPMIASSHAVAQSPTKLSVPLGETIDVDTAIKAITVLSANDVAVIVAEALGGGSETTFADMMTQRAHQLGMTNTNFHNASGLPDLQQLTTARDMSTLARHLAYDFPQYFHYFSEPSVSFRGRSYFNHDHLLTSFEGTDGIKTGYTQLSGYNLVSSVVRNNKHVIGVVMGGPTASVRDREMIRLLSATFDVANQNATFLADANVPWYGGAGPGGDLFAANPGMDNYLTAFLDSNNGRRGAPIMLAETRPGAVQATVSPLLKPATPPIANQVAEGDGVQVPFAPKVATMKGWAVQIGVFASQTLAQAQLTALARKSVDLLGQAEQIVAALPNRRGHMVYRARFGMFAENEARGICQQMKRRGHACIAVPQNPEG